MAATKRLKGSKASVEVTELQAETVELSADQAVGIEGGIELENCMISSFSLAGGGKKVPSESFSLNFTKIE